MSRLFGTDGIRGRANLYPVTPEVALQLGKAIAHVFKARGEGSERAIIGKDTRLSGYMLENALVSGFVSMGMDVFIVGPVPTPGVAHLTKSMGASVGIMLTASHNPFDDNGIKIFDQDGFKLSDEIEKTIEQHVLSKELSSEHIRSSKLGKAYRVEDARGRYIEFVKGSIHNRSLKGLKIVLDCANGAAYQVGPWIFDELGAEVIKTAAEPDGYNINNDCGALHPKNTAELVTQHHADIGIAFDGDADRVIFVDEDGTIIDGDRVLALCALHYKEEGTLARDTLVVTKMSNLGLHDAMHEADINVEVTDVGDRNVIDSMRTNGFNLGGEKSGHLIFMDYATTGDAIISSLQMLNLMKEKDCGIGELADCMTEYPQKLVSLPVDEKKPFDQVPSLQQAIDECSNFFGDSGRVIVRYSGTENKIRLLVEGREEEEVKRWIKKMTDAVQRGFSG